MPSAFRRTGSMVKDSTGNSKVLNSSASSTLVGLRGVKPWTGGIHLTSSGLNDLDVILGGGQPLGTCVLLREDRWTQDLALSLVKYWMAEAISHDQQLLVPVETSPKADEPEGEGTAPQFEIERTRLLARREEMKDLLMMIPRNLHWDKQGPKSEENPGILAGAMSSLTIMEEDEGDVLEDENLKVAWQYKKSVQEERSGLTALPFGKLSSQVGYNIFCHSYDLSGRMNEQRSIETARYISVMECTSKGLRLYDQAVALFRDFVDLIKKSMSGGKAIRLLLYHPDLETMNITLPLFLAYVRQHSLPVVVLLCVLPTADSRSWLGLSRTADVVMSTDGFASRRAYPPPPEFRHLQGLLTLSKVSTSTASCANGGGHFADLTTSKRPAAHIYGFKRDRRKLHITLLHIPPEDYAEGGGSVGSGVRSGAGKKLGEGSSASRTKSAGGMSCASNNAGSPLDF